jgi:hypothetical protein
MTLPGLWILDLWPLGSVAQTFYTTYTSILTVPLASRGTITWRLQRRHFISTPCATNRANKLPQSQRSAVSAFGVPSFCVGLNCERDSIQARFLSCASQKKVARKAQIMSPWAAKVSSVG